LVVGVEIALSEQVVLRSLLGDCDGGRNEVDGTRLEGGQDAGGLRGCDLDGSLETLADLVGEIHVEALDTARELGHGVRSKRAVDGGLERLLGECGPGSKREKAGDCHAERYVSQAHECPPGLTPYSACDILEV